MDDDLQVSSVELFFDLVFVLTITQLTTLLVAEPSGVGLAKVGLIFGNVWWMYGGYAWLTNAVPPHATARCGVPWSCTVNTVASVPSVWPGMT